jgi:hypothetical protein
VPRLGTRRAVVTGLFLSSELADILSVPLPIQGLRII